VRFDVINVTDDIYLIRSGTGIGVFAPQYGPRRGYFFGLSQKLGDPKASEPIMPTKAPPTYAWTGPYVGAHFGGAFDIEDGTIGPALLGAAMTNPLDSSGALGGFQLGYNWQLAPHWLAGVEGELSWSSIEGRTSYINTTTAVSLQSDYNKSIETLAPRIGYVQGPLLTYVKAGGAWTNIQYTVTAAGGVNGAAIVNAERSGWTFGTGIEYRLSRAWSAKAEYSFLDFGTDTVGSSLLAPGDQLAVRDQVHEVKAGVNYHWLP
ncbi:MAG TPA: outer membrane beta-barrel protein, partial [Xanthobacteraceae bacterium]